MLCEAKLQHGYMSQHGMVIASHHPSARSAARYYKYGAKVGKRVSCYSYCTNLTTRSLSALPGSTMLIVAA